MSEHAPEDEVRLSFGNAEYSCLPDMTSVYTHGPLDRDYDHIFLINPDQAENDEQTGVAFFRESLENFDEVLGMMRERDFEFIEKDKVSNFDKEMYKAYYGRDPLPATLPESALTPRQERLVSFLGYALEHGSLTADDFQGKGDLYL